MKVFDYILKDEYIAYFRDSKEFALSDECFKGFLRAMFENAQEIAKNPKNPSPYDIIDAIVYKLKLPALTEERIVEISADERLAALNAADIFVMLWFLICRNFFDPKQTVYMQMAENGTVGRLLCRLAEIA